MKPFLYIFSGLPGVGKTTIASKIAQSLKAAYFRLDTIEHGLNELCKIKVQGEGYRLTYRIAADNLRLKNNVVIDCVNPWELTRKEWEDTALENDALYVNIEIKCSDVQEHKERVEERNTDIERFELPTWEEIQKRDYEEWEKEIIVIETNNKSIDECVNELLEIINKIKIQNA